ncbi:MAG TPA: NrsF family protein [Hyphomicrobiaceae bacterium]|jgi:hypothetical protein|nr:NrsF family protein [Hyphomicrobiaceae bacterium]
MKTDDLIRALAQDAATREPAVGARLLGAVVVGAAAAGVIYALTLGPRPDLASAAQTWRFPFKVAVSLMLFACAFGASLQLARPNRCFRETVVTLALAPVLLALGVAYELATAPAADWYARAVGTNARLCLVAIPALSFASLIAALFALRAGAPRSPAAAGAVAGLLAGGLGAALYATHCPDDSPLFVAIWYSLAIALLVLAGAGAGRRLLKW